MSRLTIIGAAALAATAAMPLAAQPPVAPSSDDDYSYNSYDRSDYDADSDSITVTAPHSRVVGRSSTGAPIEERSASQTVNYSDLNLNSRWGREALYSRVDAAARDACAALDDEYGSADPALSEPANCRADAVRRAQAQVDDAIDYARYRY